MPRIDDGLPVKPWMREHAGAEGTFVRPRFGPGKNWRAHGRPFYSIRGSRP